MQNKETLYQGETSKKKNKNVRESSKPLKKARYLWQVKGKYHLKENVTKQTYNDDSEKEINISDTGITNSDSSESDNSLNYEKSNDETPVSMVSPNTKTYDYFLRKWQARQIAKGFVDNTINKILESWMVTPFDATDFVENCDNDGQIEDEGILMAIQSHGLQSGTNGPYNDHENASCTCVRRNNSAQSLIPFHHRVENDDDTSIESSTDVNSSEESNNNVSYDPLKMDDGDFLDAAVAAAIKKKGLTSYNCVDCG